MPWVSLSLRPETAYDQRVMEGTEGTTKFLLDNNIDHPTLFRFLDGRGLAAEDLPPRMRSATDE